MLILSLLTLTLVALATLCDLRSREIPDWISVVLFGGGIISACMGVSSLSVTLALAGALIGLLLTAPLFYLGGVGGGDVKLVTALGTVLGPAGLWSALFWIALGGGVLAVIARWRGQTDFAYVPAILAGLVMVMVQKGGL